MSWVLLHNGGESRDLITDGTLFEHVQVELTILVLLKLLIVLILLLLNELLSLSIQSRVMADVSLDLLELVLLHWCGSSSLLLLLGLCLHFNGLISILLRLVVVSLLGLVNFLLRLFSLLLNLLCNNLRFLNDLALFLFAILLHSVRLCYRLDLRLCFLFSRNWLGWCGGALFLGLLLCLELLDPSLLVLGHLFGDYFYLGLLYNHFGGGWSDSLDSYGRGLLYC